MPAILHGPAGLAPQERMSGGVQQGPVHLRWTYPCADGEVVITVAFGAMIGPMFKRFMDWMCEEGACDEATRDKDWVDFAIHIQQGTETVEELSRVMDLIADFAADRTKSEFLEASLERGLLVTPVADLADVVIVAVWVPIVNAIAFDTNSTKNEEKMNGVIIVVALEIALQKRVYVCSWSSATVIRPVG